MKKFLFTCTFLIAGFSFSERQTCFDTGSKIKGWPDGSYTCSYYSVCYTESGERIETEQITECEEIIISLLPYLI